ncbi:MAG: hypothetical protein KDB27_05930 [Planctomycetales bacterium]|nr:hypothetical protein [Planctomycetales bacterium]
MSQFSSIGVITPADARRALQLVGFYEYGNALKHLTDLLNTANDEQLEAIDNIVRRRPEYAVYTNLSAKVETGPSSLSIPNDYRSENNKLEGLRGVIALARVELGSMLAGFTDARLPFLGTPVHEFYASEYQQMLLDGAKTHYWSLLNDPQLKQVMRTPPENPIVLAYSRRLVIARSMLAAAVRGGRREYNNIQMRELSSWKDSLDGVQAVLVGSIQAYLTEVSMATSRTNKKSTAFTEACNRMLQAEKRMKMAGR